MSCCSGCGTNGNWGWGGCCPTCAPSNVSIRGECTDPGTITSARFLVGLDTQFCHGRIVNNAGILSNELNGSGNSMIAWRQSPKIDPEAVVAQENIAFGNILIVGSDSRLHQLEVPSTPNLVLQTNGSGDLVLNTIPAASVPDPLNVNDLGVANDATIENLEVNGDLEINNLSTGTAVNLLALDATNQVILQSLSQGLSISMFFESPTSPNASSPNKNKITGEYLIIGNRLFDSGQDNITVTTSESLTVLDAGNYLVFWSAQLRMGGSTTSGKFGVWLEVNGTVVNYGNGRTDGQVTGVDVNNGVMYGAYGMDVRPYAANDVIKLLLSENCPQEEAFEVRIIAVRIP